MSEEVIGNVMTLGQFRELTAYMDADLRMDALSNEVILFEDREDIDKPSFDFDDPNWERYSIEMWIEPERYEQDGILAFFK